MSHTLTPADGVEANTLIAPPPLRLRRPLERGWRKAKEGTPAPPKVPLRQEVVSVTGQRRGQRIVVPVKKLFAREKRPYGLGMVGKLTNRTYRKRIDSYVKRQIEDMDDHRWENLQLRLPASSRRTLLILHPLHLQALFHLLDHLCPLAHHHPGRVHLRHRARRLLSARDGRLCEWQRRDASSVFFNKVLPSLTAAVFCFCSAGFKKQRGL